VIVTVSNGWTISGMEIVGLFPAAWAAEDLPACNIVTAGTRAARANAARTIKVGQRKSFFNFYSPCIKQDKKHIGCL